MAYLFRLAGIIAFIVGMLILAFNMSVRSEVRKNNPNADLSTEAHMEDAMNGDKDLYITMKEWQLFLLGGGAAMIVLGSIMERADKK
jgi:hypothetical protein